MSDGNAMEKAPTPSPENSTTSEIPESSSTSVCLSSSSPIHSEPAQAEPVPSTSRHEPEGASEAVTDIVRDSSTSDEDELSLHSAEGEGSFKFIPLQDLEENPDDDYRPCRTSVIHEWREPPRPQPRPRLLPFPAVLPDDFYSTLFRHRQPGRMQYVLEINDDLFVANVNDLHQLENAFRCRLITRAEYEYLCMHRRLMDRSSGRTRSPRVPRASSARPRVVQIIALVQEDPREDESPDSLQCEKGSDKD